MREQRIGTGVKLYVQLEVINVEDRNSPVLGNAQKGTLEPSHGVSLDTDCVG